MGEHNQGAESVSATDDTSAELSAARGEAAEQRYQRMLDYSPDAICVHQNGRIVYVNRAGVLWMGVPTSDHLVGASITEFVHPDSIPAMLDRIAGLRRQGDVSEPSEALMSAFDGTRVDVEAVSVLTVWNGEPAYQVTFRDISARKAAQSALRFQAALVDHVSDAIIATTDAGVVTAWNPAAEAIYRRTAEEALGLPVTEAVGAELNPSKIVAEGGRADIIHYAKDAATLTIRLSAAAMDGGGYVLLCTDLSALRRAEQHFHTVVQSLEEGVVVLDHVGKLVSANPAARHVLGLPVDYPPNSWKAAGRWQLGPDTPADVGSQPVRDTIATGRPFTGTAYSDSPTGDRRWLAVSSRRLTPEDGARSAVLITFHDVTAARQATEKFAHQALHDPLTGLPNRADLTAHLDRLIVEGTLGAVLFVDLDDMKSVNDSLGHDAGDQVIQIAAQRIRDAVRDVDSVYRLAGDEFIVLVAGQLSAVGLEGLKARIETRLTEPMAVSGRVVGVGGSVGVVDVAGDEPPDPAALLREADRAMYAAKSHGRRAATIAVDGSAEQRLSARRLRSARS